jgi:hypothetical protein
MNEFLASSIIQWYEDLEECLIAYLKTTPYIHYNLGVRAAQRGRANVRSNHSWSLRAARRTSS